MSAWAKYVGLLTAEPNANVSSVNIKVDVCVKQRAGSKKRAAGSITVNSHLKEINISRAIGGANALGVKTPVNPKFQGRRTERTEAHL